MSASKKSKTGSGPACPVCGRTRVAQHRPFCSSRCAQHDLGHWLNGNYRIPTNEEPEDMEGNPDAIHEISDQED